MSIVASPERQISNTQHNEVNESDVASKRRESLEKNRLAGNKYSQNETSPPPKSVTKKKIISPFYQLLDVANEKKSNIKKW
jgi:hypothetical protein